MELNAEQIKKVLEHCSNWTADTGCKGCPYDGECIDEDVIKDALALITSQEQRIGAQDMTISELRQRTEKAEHDADRYAQRIKELTEENERLIDAGFDTVDFAIKKKRDAKSDTVRKMQDKVRKKIKKTDWLNGRAVYLAIDQIAKEMLEEGD